MLIKPNHLSVDLTLSRAMKTMGSDLNYKDPKNFQWRKHKKTWIILKEASVAKFMEQFSRLDKEITQ